MRLVYVSPVPLSSFAQRPHHFVEWFHKHHDAEVLWVEPGPSRLPRLGDARRLWRALGGAGPDLSPPWSRESWLHHLRCRVAPVEPLHWGRVLNQQLWRPVLKAIDEFVTPDTRIVLGKPCALSLELSRRYPGLDVVFDVMDHLSDFFEGRSRRWMRQAETSLAEEVRWSMASSFLTTCGQNTLPLSRCCPAGPASSRFRSSSPTTPGIAALRRWSSCSPRPPARWTLA